MMNEQQIIELARKLANARTHARIAVLERIAELAPKCDDLRTVSDAYKILADAETADAMADKAVA